MSAGVLFFLASQYGTYEFFGTGCLMALLPFVPIMVLVGGAGSTIFVLTKVVIEKRSIKTAPALALLVGPGLALTLLLGWLGAGFSPAHRLAYICVGNAPGSASHVRVAGYSTFLREEWLATFTVGQNDFQTMVANAKLAPADEFEFRKSLAQSSFAGTRLFQNLPPMSNAICYQRVFKEKEEHERGRLDVAFDPAISMAIVFRECRD